MTALFEDPLLDLYTNFRDKGMYRSSNPISYLILLILHYICHHSCYKIKTQLGLAMISGQITHPLEKLFKKSFIISFAVDDTR